MPHGIARKWRPPLLLVLGGALLGVLTVALVGILLLPHLAIRFGDRMAVAIVIIGALVATALLAFLLWRLILRPVTALADRAHELREGNASALAPLPHYGTPELRDLGASVLDMAATLQNREATIRSYTDHVTHELKAPIAAIRGAAELLASDADSLAEDEARLVSAILSSTERMESLLAALRRIAEAREPRARGHTRLAEIVSPLQTGHSGLTITISGDDIDLPLSAESLGIILDHLAGNAVQHGAQNLRIEASDPRTGPVLRIADDGPGITPGNRDRVFQPFFTTRRDYGGTGMGLAIVSSLLDAHSARITLEDAVAGTVFRIDF